MDRVDHQLLLNQDSGNGQRRRYSVGLARDRAGVRSAQKLRWRVFAEELGVHLPSRILGIDQDIFDAHCEHLIVNEDDTGEVVGTYRILAPDAARRVGGYHADNVFDLTRLRLLRERLVEVGRACIHPDHRNGAVIALLWAGLARYMLSSGHAYLSGCASTSIADGGHCAASLFERFRPRHLAPVEFRVHPRRRMPLDELDATRPVEAPPLIRGYLRAGAWICGEPAWNPECNTADFFMLLPLAQLNPRHARHFFGGVLRAG